jgi:hypothetical protein
VKFLRLGNLLPASILVICTGREGVILLSWQDWLFKTILGFFVFFLCFSCLIVVNRFIKAKMNMNN